MDTSINDMKVGEVLKIAALFSGDCSQDISHPYEIGKNYFIRTVTNFFTGKLESVGEKELLLSSVCWIADTGRFSNAMDSADNLGEIEPYPDGAKVAIGRGAIIDAVVWSHDLPRKQK